MRLKMKDKIIGWAVFILLMLLLGRAGYYETTYKIGATVTDVTGSTAEYTDTRGHIWIGDRENHEIGDHVTLVMFNNGTDFYLSDDCIHRVK